MLTYRSTAFLCMLQEQTLLFSLSSQQKVDKPAEEYQLKSNIPFSERNYTVSSDSHVMGNFNKWY